MFERILVAVDLEYADLAEKAVRTALFVGGEQAEYMVVTVLPPIGAGIIASYLPKDYDRRLKAETETRLKAFMQERFPQAALHYGVAHGPVYEEINLLAKQRNADLVVVSSGKPGSSGLGPNAARVARYGESSVLIIR